jgi:hypothetical protein
MTPPNETPGLAFLACGIHQPGIPGQRDGQTAPIIQIDCEGIFRGVSAQHSRDFEFNF